MTEKTFTIVFTLDQLYLLDQALQTLPFGQVHKLIASVNQQLQVQQQLAPSKETE